MAESESPENRIAAMESTSSSTSDLNFSIRRRSTVTDSASTEMMGSEVLKSSGKSCDKVKVENQSEMKFNYRPSMPAHSGVRESPLSSDAIFKQSHAGLFNLCIVVLVAVNSRLIIENLIKYGWLINSGFWFSSKSLRDWPLFMCWCDSALLSGGTLMLFACIVWLKLVSFAHTSSDMRAIAKSIDKENTQSISSNADNYYDANFKSLVYFMVAPTLCYQEFGFKDLAVD
ncbi:hypothetical protein H0E87_031497, partial [Populus deltoides]